MAEQYPFFHRSVTPGRRVNEGDNVFVLVEQREVMGAISDHSSRYGRGTGSPNAPCGTNVIVCFIFWPHSGITAVDNFPMASLANYTYKKRV